jgi:alkanesulfonate monooxygenase SsuD/methylene tetrahydromethanopterin reductase-like flavin-dependent oxidoreductase (luciferase family)
MFEAFTMLAALAQHTTTIRLGQLVTCTSYRNPGLLAKEAACVDVYSNGRLILGLGAGWYGREYQAYGYEYLPDRDRLRALEETVSAIKRLWTEETVTVTGEHVNLDGAYCDPKPVQQLPEIWIGGGGEKVTLRIAAQYADQWHTFGAPDDWARKSAILDEWCKKVGRDPAAIERTCAARPEQFSVLDEYVSLGATQLIYGWDHPWDKGQLQELLVFRDQANASR